MAVDADALTRELRSLRKGQATRQPQFVEHLGPQIREVCQIGNEDGSAAARQKLKDTFKLLLASEDPKVRLAVFAALALLPEAGQRTLRARELWLEQGLGCHGRTVRRRVDEAFDILVALAVERTGGRHDLRALDGWQVQSTRAVLDLTGPSPELTEYRTLQFTRDGVDEIITSFSLPRPDRSVEGSHDLRAKIEFGGRILGVDRPSDLTFRYRIELPRAFRHSETHEYGIRFFTPPGQPMAPHYALVPLVPVQALDLRIRFRPDGLPLQIWKLDGVEPRMVDAHTPSGDILYPDRHGEVSLDFQRLRQGRAYGARWQPAPHAGTK